jgi:hypothetical protein
VRWREFIIALGSAMAWPIAADGHPDVWTLRSRILVMQAEGISDKLAQFIKETQNQVGPDHTAAVDVRSQRVIHDACHFIDWMSVTTILYAYYSADGEAR